MNTVSVEVEGEEEPEAEMEDDIIEVFSRTIGWDFLLSLLR